MDFSNSVNGLSQCKNKIEILDELLFSINTNKKLLFDIKDHSKYFVLNDLKRSEREFILYNTISLIIIDVNNILVNKDSNYQYLGKTFSCLILNIKDKVINSELCLLKKEFEQIELEYSKRIEELRDSVFAYKDNKAKNTDTTYRMVFDVSDRIILVVEKLFDLLKLKSEYETLDMFKYYAAYLICN